MVGCFFGVFVHSYQTANKVVYGREVENEVFRIYVPKGVIVRPFPKSIMVRLYDGADSEPGDDQNFRVRLALDRACVHSVRFVADSQQRNVDIGDVYVPKQVLRKAFKDFPTSLWIMIERLADAA